jgi:hypothetical protein
MRGCAVTAIRRFRLNRDGHVAPVPYDGSVALGPGPTECNHYRGYDGNRYPSFHLQMPFMSSIPIAGSPGRRFTRAKCQCVVVLR